MAGALDFPLLIHRTDQPPAPALSMLSAMVAERR
jgi:hypothetical protein